MFKLRKINCLSKHSKKYTLDTIYIYEISDVSLATKYYVPFSSMTPVFVRNHVSDIGEINLNVIHSQAKWYELSDHRKLKKNNSAFHKNW